MFSRWGHFDKGQLIRLPALGTVVLRGSWGVVGGGMSCTDLCKGPIKHSHCFKSSSHQVLLS